MNHERSGELSANYDADEWPPARFDEALGIWSQLLPELARELIATTHDLNDESSASFVLDPDGLKEHQPAWHQHGILTHSIRVEEALQTKVPSLGSGIYWRQFRPLWLNL